MARSVITRYIVKYKLEGVDYESIGLQEYYTSVDDAIEGINKSGYRYGAIWLPTDEDEPSIEGEVRYIQYHIHKVDIQLTDDELKDMRG